MHAPLECHSVSFPVRTQQFENCDRASMRNASLSATANERHEFSLLSEIKLRVKMALLVGADAQASCLQLVEVGCEYQ
jgi:hypothetical protein